MIILIHGSNLLDNCMIADDLLLLLPKTTIRIDQSYWEGINGSDEEDCAYKMAKFLSKQGFICLMTFQNPDIEKLSSDCPVVEIGIFPNLEGENNSMSGTPRVHRNLQTLHIYTYKQAFRADYVTSKIKDFLEEFISV